MSPSRYWASDGALLADFRYQAAALASSCRSPRRNAHVGRPEQLGSCDLAGFRRLAVPEGSRLRVLRDASAHVMGGGDTSAQRLEKATIRERSPDRQGSRVVTRFHAAKPRSADAAAAPAGGFATLAGRHRRRRPQSPRPPANSIAVNPMTPPPGLISDEVIAQLSGRQRKAWDVAEHHLLALGEASGLMGEPHCLARPSASARCPVNSLAWGSLPAEVWPTGRSLQRRRSWSFGLLVPLEAAGCASRSCCCRALRGVTRRMASGVGSAAASGASAAAR